MLSKRIIPCLDVRDGQVVKGVQFRNHEIVGEIVELAQRYAAEGADELVFYDITASSDRRTVTSEWVEQVARVIDIPFCVAGGIRAVADAERILHSGADKISINSPALENPRLIGDIAEAFGTQCIVVGIDSKAEDGDWFVYQYTGDPEKTRPAKRRTVDWIREAADRGAGEVVLNCMNQDGMRQGYDLPQLAAARQAVTIPIVASGGAGAVEHFRDLFRKTRVDAALAASVFHKGVIAIAELKAYLSREQIPVRQ